MRVTPLLAVVALAVSALAAPAGATAETPHPNGPNPYLSWLPGRPAEDHAAWRERLARESAARPSTLGRSAPEFREAEPPDTLGRNDALGQAEAVPGFGTGPGRSAVVRVLGRLSPAEDAADVDFYRVDLRAGDVFGARVTGAAGQLAIFDPAGLPMQGSAQDLSAIYPAASPLPRGGNAVADHVAGLAGAHYLAVSAGSGDYEVTVQAHRPPLEREAVPQVVFLDFDGAQVDMGIFGIEPSPGVRELTPFSAFLSGWGLSTSDEPAVVRQIVRTVRENLAEDAAEHGNNPATRLVVLNSLQHPDLFGTRNVSRVVLGGTTEEAGFPTVGIAQSIDPGNFDQEETALVLQDFLSQPAGPAVSLNTYLTADSDRIRFIGRAIGNVVAHEIGHYVGNWHTDPENEVQNLMDAGGAQVARFFGVGPDGVGGSADDTDTDLAVDVFRPLEEFTGFEDSVNRTAFGLTWFRPAPAYPGYRPAG